MEYKGYKVVETESGRKMYYKDGKLTSKKDIPEDVLEFLSHERESEVEDLTEEDTEGIEGFKDISLDEDATSEIKKDKETKARKILKKRFPDFNYDVTYKAPYTKENGRKVKARYFIDIFRGDSLVKSLKLAGFDLNEVNQNIEAIYEGWTESPSFVRRRGAKRKEDRAREAKLTKKHLGDERYQI